MKLPRSRPQALSPAELRRALYERGIDQYSLSRWLGVEHSTVNRWCNERGPNPPPWLTRVLELLDRAQPPEGGP